tara:strand:- start:374 stop:862 length:489 start_codon:yes stop_codon:yes gene_type:complete
MKDIISNCFLCEEHSLHVAGTEEAQVMQCINCGYVTSTKYVGTIKTNEEVKKLSSDMKQWAKEENGRVWIPSIITLPIGMLYPIDDKGSMKWSFAPMVDIPEGERKNYPNGKGDFYERKIDTDNPIIYDEFIVGMSYINKLMKEAATPKPSKITLPKLKKSK